LSCANFLTGKVPMVFLYLYEHERLVQGAGWLSLRPWSLSACHAGPGQRKHCR
jgi:hypothetical protein